MGGNPNSLRFGSLMKSSLSFRGSNSQSISDSGGGCPSMGCSSTRENRGSFGPCVWPIACLAKHRKRGFSMHKTLGLLVLGLLLTSAMPATATPVTAPTVTMELVGVSGSAGGANASGGVYVYPYYFSING